MRFSFAFVFAVISFCAATSESHVAEIEPANMDTILRAVGAPPCMRKCVDPLINDLSSIWNLKELTKDTVKICRAHETAIDCLRSSQFCDLHDAFAKASSPLRHRCETQAALFADVEECMTQNVDKVMQKCDAQCSARSNLTAFANHQSIKLAAQIGGNIFIVTDHVGELCGAFKCLLPCITTELNSFCPLSGWVTLDALLQPLEAVSLMMDGMNPTLKEIIFNKMDRRCHFVLDSKIQKKIRKGKFDILGH